jgi:hypothetical protein
MRAHLRDATGNLVEEAIMTNIGTAFSSCHGKAASAWVAAPYSAAISFAFALAFSLLVQC